MKKNRKQAFTLIEMLVVIILIGIILAIVLPSVTKLSNNRSKKMYETHLDVVVESAVDLYTDQYKGELADENAECFNINYQTLLKDGLVDETDVFCDGNIIIRDNKSTNSLENSYYLTCRDSKGNEINKSEKVPSGCRGFNGKFKMEYAIYTDSAKTKPYDGTYYVKDAYVVFTSTSPYSFAIDHYEYSIKLDGNWKTIPSGSNLGSIADIKNLDGILNVRAVDQDNNESSSVRIPVKLDNTGPTFTTSMTGGWLEKTVTISEATDKQVGTLAELPYSFDGGQNWQKEPTKNYIENKKINICVRDSLDNKTCKDFEISGIDRVKPDAPTITVSDTIGSGKWHKENFTITLSGAHNLSGNTYYYGETNPPKTTGPTISVSEDTTSKVYYLQVCSGAGICSDVVNYEVKLDKSTPKAPTIAAGDKIGSGSWHKADTTLTASGSSAPSGVTYYLDKNSTPTTVVTNGSLTITENTASTKYYAKACSGAGKCSSVASYELKLDKSTPKAPTLAATDGIASGSWHKADTTLTASGSSSTSGITYYLDTNSNPTAARSIFTITSNTKSTTYYAKACNGSGLCSSVASYELKLDKSTPQCSIVATGTAGSGGWYTNNVTLKLQITETTSGVLKSTLSQESITENTAGQVVTGNVTSTAGIIGNCTTTIKLDKTTPSAPAIAATDGIGSNSWHNQTFTLNYSGANNISQNTYYYGTTASPNTVGASTTINQNSSGTTYYVKVCSGAGLCSGNSTYVAKLDATTPNAPTITATDGIGSNSWHNKAFTLNYSGANNISQNTYYYGTTASPTTVGTSTTINQNSSTSSGTTYYVKVCSGAGLCSGNSTYVAKLDTITPSAPTITATDGIGSNSWHKQAFTLNYSGANNVSQNTYYYGTTASPNTVGASTTINQNSPTSSGTTYYVKVCSGAGLCSGNSTYAVKLDATTPTVTAKAANNNITTATNANIQSYFNITTSGPSGGSTVCKVGSKTVSNTNNLSQGLNTVVCTATSGSGLTASASTTFHHQYTATAGCNNGRRLSGGNCVYTDNNCSCSAYNQKCNAWTKQCTGYGTKKVTRNASYSATRINGGDCGHDSYSSKSDYSCHCDQPLNAISGTCYVSYSEWVTDYNNCLGYKDVEPCTQWVDDTSSCKSWNSCERTDNNSRTYSCPTKGTNGNTGASINATVSGSICTF